MFIYIIKPLIVNYTIIIAFLVSTNLFFPLKKRKQYPFNEQVIYALVGTLAAVLCMFYPIEVLGDTNFDFRMVILLVLTLYRGKWVGLFCFFIVTIMRIIIGGEFVVPGVVINIIAYLLGIGFRKPFLEARQKAPISFVIFICFTVLSLITLELFVPFLTSSFYIIYFSLFFPTMIGLIFTMEKLMEINQQIEDTLYVEHLKTVSHMAAAFAHEIRNPLTTVRGFIQFLMTNNQHHLLPQYSDLILEELNRTNEIISDYLSLSKPGKDGRETFVVETTLKAMVELIKPTAQMKNITIDLDLPNEHLVHVEKKFLKQALLNILKNAVEAIENKGTTDGKITVKSMSLPIQKVAIIIEDNGIGLTKEEVKKIGLPYYTTKSKGTGLGTLIIHKLIQDMGGTVHYYSQKNQWTRVEIVLPVYKK
jgi:two-component system, sporulation sensor kinase B